MKNKFSKIISFVLVLTMLISTLSVFSASAVAGDSASNPVICRNFAELKSAMESNVTYVKLISNNQRNELTGVQKNGYAIRVTSPKVLTLEGNNTFAAKKDNEVAALFGLESDVTVNGTGKLTFITYAKGNVAAIFSHICDCLLTLNLTGTLEALGTDGDDYNVAGKIIYSNVGRIYITDGNYIGTYNGLDKYIDNDTGAIDIGGTAKMMIRGGNFHTYNLLWPQHDFLLPAIYINPTHKAPGYVTIDGGTFNGIRSDAKKLSAYISANCVVVDETAGKIVDYKNIDETPMGLVPDGDFEAENYNVVSVLQYTKPDFFATYPNMEGEYDNLFEELTGTEYDILVAANPVSESLADKGFYVRKKLEIVDPNGNVVHTDVNSTSDTIHHKFVFEEIGNYYIYMYVALCYNDQEAASKKDTYIIRVSCDHKWEVIENTINCLTPGEKISQCILCGEEKTETSDALGHKSIDGYLTDATKHHKVCDNCLQIFESEEHDFNGDACKVCGYIDGCEPEYMSHESDDEYHWFLCSTHPEGECPNGGQLEKAPHVPTGKYNCQQGYECEECGWYYGEKGKHLWVIDEVRCEEPTYETDGKLVYTCGYYGQKNNRGETIVCKELLEIKIPALRHQWDYENPVSNTATCEHDGLITYKCLEDGCDEIYEMHAEKLDHNEEWVVIVEPTTEATGTKALTCKNCGAVSKYEDISMVDFMLGDVNDSGDIDSMDYVLVKRAYFGTFTFNDQQLKRGDVNKSGDIDSMDYVLIKRAYFGTFSFQ